jgi:hypothetical protein
MKPQGYLTENGKAIFDFIIESHLKSNGIMEVDTYNLTALANAFDLHERASYIMNHPKEGEEFSRIYRMAKNTGYDS